jgi:hypothetical protein
LNFKLVAWSVRVELSSASEKRATRAARTKKAVAAFQHPQSGGSRAIQEEEWTDRSVDRSPR